MAVETELEVMKEVREINSSYPYTTPIKAWKETGKKVMAFQCTYIPEEVIYAAGILPVRLTGATTEIDLEDANAYMYLNTCSFIRSCLQMVLNGEYDFLDGLVAGNCCDPSRRFADVWEHYEFKDFVHILDVPRTFSELAYELYESQVRDLKRHLEEHFQVKITDEKLWDAVEVYNKGRSLLRKLHELKKLDAPPITGAETMEILNASRRMPPQQFNQMMERLLQEIAASKREVKGKFRVLINGSPLNNSEYIKAIENLGGLVVVDELCTGIRYWFEGVDPAKDPIEAISRRYLHNFACPRMSPCEDRFERVLKLTRDYRIDAVITGVVRHCVPWAHDEPLLRRRLEDAGIPVLELDLEYSMPATGQILTRVQAFLEMLQ